MQKLKQWPAVQREIESAGHVLLLFDFDGTLAPIVDNPSVARILPEAHSALFQLARLPFCTLGFISGRALSDLEARVRIPGCYYAGNHGMEGRTPEADTLDYDLNREQLSAMRTLARVLAGAAGKIPGVVVEDKGPTLSLHYRAVAAEHRAAAVAYMQGLLAQWQAAVDVYDGKMVFEVRPKGAPDKGVVAEQILARVRREAGEDVVAFYFGDDAGDEPAFTALSGAAYTIRIGPPADSNADHFLESPPELAQFLSTIARLLSGRAAGPATGRVLWSAPSPA